MGAIKSIPFQNHVIQNYLSKATLNYTLFGNIKCLKSYPKRVGRNNLPSAQSCAGWILSSFNFL